MYIFTYLKILKHCKHTKDSYANKDISEKKANIRAQPK
jgi:hypothetical protein